MVCVASGHVYFSIDNFTIDFFYNPFFFRQSLIDSQKLLLSLHQIRFNLNNDTTSYHAANFSLIFDCLP